MQKLKPACFGDKPPPTSTPRQNLSSDYEVSKIEAWIPPPLDFGLLLPPEAMISLETVKKKKLFRPNFLLRPVLCSYVKIARKKSRHDRTVFRSCLR